MFSLFANIPSRLVNLLLHLAVPVAGRPFGIASLSHCQPSEVWFLFKNLKKNKTQKLLFYLDLFKFYLNLFKFYFKFKFLF